MYLCSVTVVRVSWQRVDVSDGAMRQRRLHLPLFDTERRPEAMRHPNIGAMKLSWLAREHGLKTWTGALPVFRRTIGRARFSFAQAAEDHHGSG